MSVCFCATAVSAGLFGSDAAPKLIPNENELLEQLKALPEEQRNELLSKLGYKRTSDVRDLQSAASKLNDAPEQKESVTADKAENTSYSLHYQGTIITQKHDVFRSPYANPNTSLQPREDEKTSTTGTVFFGHKLWDGGELYFNPEFSGGEGLSQVTGVAGFPNGDIERVGSVQPTVYVARLFLKETINFGCATEHVEDGPNQVAGERATDRLILQFGKMAATDVFDSNTYSHDPRSQFMNWSLMDYGAWDYPADTRGYSPGITAEYNTVNWTLRYGMFMEPKRANGAQYDFKLDRANSQDLEFERRYKLHDHSGAVRVLAFDNNAHMGLYRRAIDEADGGAPNLTPTRAYRSRFGFGVNAEQEITSDLGAFFRASWNNGRAETWSFTEIDESVSAGATLKGTRWSRDADTLGLAVVVNGLSNDHRDFLKAGGTGFIVGDGKLNYSPEKILELYYRLAMNKNLSLTLDYQFVSDPAYNQDRGPVNIGGVRFHLDF